MEITCKIWGETSKIFAKNNVEIHRIEGKAGGYSSNHIHHAKYNAFFCESGKILVKISKNYGSGILEDITILGPKQQTIVPPGHWHSFEVIEDCVAYEIYWVELDPNDIERETVGGIKEDL